jgi:hypothetical protein
MHLWLDFLIFGNGYGLAAPYHDQRFFWLSGDLYTWIGGHGAQLRSRQWFHPRPGERRRLIGRDFEPFTSSRRWLRVEISWRMVGFPRDIIEASAAIRSLEREISRV